MSVATPAPRPVEQGRKPRAGAAPGLTVFRGLAVLFIVLSHAAIPYMDEPPKGIAWPVREPGGGAGLDWLYLWARASQPVFFVFSGMLAAAALQRQAPRAFLRDRWKMLGRPLLVATVTVLPVCYAVWMWGWWRTGYITAGQMLEFRFSDTDKRDLLGFGHLWYIEYLLLYTAAYGGWRAWRGRPAGGVPPRWPPMLAALAAWLIAWAFADPAMITDFRNGFLPTGTFLAFNAGFFALGAALWSARASLAGRARPWAGLVLASQGLCAAWLVLRQADMAPAAQTVLMTLFALTAALGWSCLGVAWTPAKDGPARPLIVLARSSYWIYLVHLPVLGAAHVLLYAAPMPAWSKVVVAAVAGLGLPFAAHRVIRRRRASPA